MGKKTIGKKPQFSANPAASNASEVNPLDLARLLSTPQQRDAFIKGFHGKPLISPKSGNIFSFEVSNFQFPRFIDSTGLRAFCKDHGPYYPELVRVFFCNMSVKSGKLLTAVKGKTISMTPTQLGTILGIQSQGVQVVFGQTCMGPEWENFNKKSVYYSLCRMSAEEIAALKRQRVTSSSKDTLSVGPLTLDDRLLHYFLCYVIVPKPGNYSQINEFELYLLYAIKNNIPVNWSYVFIHHMDHLRKKHMPLPYARAITHILAAYDVSLTGETMLTSADKDHIIDLDVITRIGFVQDPRTRVFRPKQGVVPPEANPEDPAAPSSSNPMPPPVSEPQPNPAPTLQNIMDYMVSMNDNINNRFDYLEVQYQELRSDFGELSQRVDAMYMDDDEDANQDDQS